MKPMTVFLVKESPQALFTMTGPTNSIGLIEQQEKEINIVVLLVDSKILHAATLLLEI